MEAFTHIIYQTLLQTVTSFAHNWPYLIISIVISVLLKLYLDADKAAKFLLRHQRAGVLGATAVAVTTPLCSCGTTAVVLGMMASLLPWAPIVAFMVASPLTSPEELVYSAGLFGWHFAWAFFISSILLGLVGGLAGAILEKRGWLKNQARMAERGGDADWNSPSPHPLPRGAREKSPSPRLLPQEAREEAQIAGVNRWEFGTVGGLTLQPDDEQASSGRWNAAGKQKTDGCGCGEPDEESPVFEQAMGGCSCSAPVQETEATRVETGSCACSKAAVVTTEPAETPDAEAQSGGCSCGAPAGTGTSSQAKPRVTWRLFGKELFTTGKRLLIMFAGFAFIGYLLNNLIPAAWVAAIFGKGNIYSVPLAATLGVPFYINTEGSLPLVRALIDGGMSQGAALAFLITGAGTSVGAIAGALTIARWRVIGLVVGTLWVGAVVVGFLYNFLLAAGLV